MIEIVLLFISLWGGVLLFTAVKHIQFGWVLKCTWVIVDCTYCCEKAAATTKTDNLLHYSLRGDATQWRRIVELFSL